MSATTFASELAQYGPGTACQQPSLAAAQAYCRRLARSHYENFTVASWLLPAELRPHFCNIYAYCRWSDDLADETAGGAASLELLDWWQSQLDDCYRGVAVHPVFVALRPTIEEFEIPIDPFRDLLTAFRQDQTVTRYETFDQLLGYCRNSANPVGRLVLYLGRCHDETRGQLSDFVCTGLQLANFWQDVARDCQRGRIYLPQKSCHAAGCDEAMFARREFNPQFRQLLQDEVDRAESYLRRGEPLAALMPPALAIDVRLFIDGGLAILEAIRQIDYNVWRKRPTVGKWKKARLLFNAWRNSRSDANIKSRTFPSPQTLDASYRHCQQLARRSASNFYFSFLLLPREKRRAMCALYAYLRHVDDLGDDETSDIDRRRTALAKLRQNVKQIQYGDSSEEFGKRTITLSRDEAVTRGDANNQHDSSNQILPALADTVACYRIPVEYLTAVIDGVEMDLAGQRYESFAELESYCYRVASVVGLACIHIWGFRSPDAIEPARRCGIAFQLTNILRDLKEDSQRGRIYLPQEDLRRFDYTTEELSRREVNENFLKLMQFEISRAEEFYEAAEKLESQLEPDGARVFRAMSATYFGLLEKIKRDPSAVFNRRIRLNAIEKIQIAFSALLYSKSNSTSAAAGSTLR